MSFSEYVKKAKYTADEFSALPEDFKSLGLYTLNSENEYTLPLSREEAEKLTDLTGMKTALNKERDNAGLMRSEISQFKKAIGDDVTPERLVEILKEYETLKKSNIKPANATPDDMQYKNDLLQLTEKSQFEQEQLKKEITKILQEKDASESALKQTHQKQMNEMVLSFEQRKAAAAAGVMPDYIDMACQDTRDSFEVIDGKVLVVAREGDRTVPQSKSPSAFFKEDYLKMRPALFKGVIPSGGGINISGSSPARNDGKVVRIAYSDNQSKLANLDKMASGDVFIE